MQLRVKSTIVVHMVPVAHRFRGQSSFGIPAQHRRLDGVGSARLISTTNAQTPGITIPNTGIVAILYQKAVKKVKLGDVDMLYRVVEKQQRECSDPFAKKVWDIILEVISICPEIDPEALPIVRRLREELARVTAERDAAVEQLSELECCEFCEYTGCIPRGGVGKCEWRWCGPRKEE